MNPNDPREDAALDALLAASLRVSDIEVSQEEVEVFLKHAAELPPEYRAAVEEASSVDDIIFLAQNGAEGRETAARPPVQEVVDELYFAMNRKNREDKHSAETEEEITRRRREGRDRIEAKKRRKAE